MRVGIDLSKELTLKFRPPFVLYRLYHSLISPSFGEKKIYYLVRFYAGKAHSFEKPLQYRVVLEEDCSLSAR